MTTSQASRIFGIPYNSLLMYVRGKYGKSLRLDVLKRNTPAANDNLNTIGNSRSTPKEKSSRGGASGSSTSTREDRDRPGPSGYSKDKSSSSSSKDKAGPSGSSSAKEKRHARSLSMPSHSQSQASSASPVVSMPGASGPMGPLSMFNFEGAHAHAGVINPFLGFPPPVGLADSSFGLLGLGMQGKN